MAGSDRRRISSGSRWEQLFGYSRAVVIGERCLVSGTTDPSGSHPGDAAGQAREALQIIGSALTEAGFSLADVVRTRMYVTREADAEAVAAIHGEVFGEIRPAATMISAGLSDPRMRIEIEVTARKRSGA